MDIIESFTQALRGDLGQEIRKNTIDRSYTHEDFKKWELYFKEKGLYKEIAEKEISEQNIPALCEFIYTLSQYFPSLAYYFLSIILFGILALKFSATEDQKEKYLDRLVKDSLFATFTSKELEAGFELRKMQTIARKEDYGWVINGGKEDVACTLESDLFLLLGKIEQSSAEKVQFGLFLLEKNTPGITAHYSENKKSASPIRTASLTFENLAVNEDQFLGSLQNKHEVFNRVLDLWNLMLAAQLLGITRSVFEQGLNHALEINRFGQRYMDAPYIQQQFAQYKIELDVTEQYFLTINSLTQHSTIQVTQLKYKAMEVSNEVIDGILGIFGSATLPPDHVLRNFKSIAESVKNIGEAPEFHLKKISKQWIK